MLSVLVFVALQTAPVAGQQDRDESRQMVAGIVKQQNEIARKRALPPVPVAAELADAGRAALRGPFWSDRYSPRLTDEQLARALSRHESKVVSSNQVRAGGCHADEVEAKIFACSYDRKGNDGHWTAGLAAFVIARNEWQIVATPASSR